MGSTMINVAIVIGHTSDAQGAYGNYGQGEWQFNDELMMEMAQRDMLSTDEVTVFVLYHDASIKSYTKRQKAMHKRIDEIGCEVSIELHFNSFHRPEANGNEVLYCSKGGKKVADIFDEEMDILPNRDRGVKKVSLPDDRGAGFCCRGKSKAIILEPFFGANQTDYIYGGKNRMLLMTAISNGLKRLHAI